MAYDDALFVQKVKNYAKNGKVKPEHVEQAFWEVAPELKHAIRIQKPYLENAASAYFHQDLLPRFAKQLKDHHGIEVED